MSNYIASIKKSNISTIFQPHLQLYLNSILGPVKIFNHYNKGRTLHFNIFKRFFTLINS